MKNDFQQLVEDLKHLIEKYTAVKLLVIGYLFYGLASAYLILFSLLSNYLDLGRSRIDFPF